MSIFYERFLRLCTNAKKSPSGVATAIGLSNAAATGWKNGKNPSDTTIYKLADYFGVPVSYFKEEEQKENPGTTMDTEVSPLKAELLGLVDNATDEQLQDYLDMLRIVLNRREKR